MAVRRTLTRRAALVLLGVVVGGALGLGVAAPANAVTGLGSLADYQLTVPPSVWRSAPPGVDPAPPLTPGEEAIFRELTRAGGGSLNPGSLLEVPTRAIPGAIAPGISVDTTALDDVCPVASRDPDCQRLRSLAAASGHHQVGWCDGTGIPWLDNFFHGFAGSVNDTMNQLGLGQDCSKLIAYPAPAYANNGKTFGGNLPQHISFRGCSVDAGTPFWSTTVRNGAGGQYYEGWVFPLKMVSADAWGSGLHGCITSDPTWQIYDGAGNKYDTSPSGNNAGFVYTGTGCPSGYTCYVATAAYYFGANYYTSTFVNGSRASTLINVNIISRDWPGQSTAVSINVVPPTFHSLAFGSGLPTATRAWDQVWVTVTASDGTVYQCKTAAYDPTALLASGDGFPMCDPGVPAGKIVASRLVEAVPITETSYTPGSKPEYQLQKQVTTQAGLDWAASPCAPGGANYPCKLDLLRSGVSCFSAPDPCANWVQDNAANPGVYQCTYGGSNVAITECADYAPTFKPNAVAQGTVYAPQPQQRPDIQTSTVPGGGVAPGDQVQNPDQPRNCFPTGWGILNPVEWVVKPVRCALEWAFVPRQRAVDDFGGKVRAAWTGSSLVGLLGVFATAQHLVLSSGSCEGPLIAISLPRFGMNYSGHPLSACADPMRTAATVSYTVSGIVVWLVAISSIAKSIGGVVQFRGVGGGEDDT